MVQCICSTNVSPFPSSNSSRGASSTTRVVLLFAMVDHEEKETTSGFHFSDTGSFLTVTGMQIENASGSAYGPNSSGLYIDTPSVNDYTFSSLAVGEIDDTVRIVQPTTVQKTYVWNAAPSGATLHASLTQSGSGRSTPTIADVDQDGDVDVIVRSAGTISKSVVAFEGEDSTSVLECCWPEDVIFEDSDLPIDPVAVGNLGGDDKLELVTGGWDFVVDTTSTSAADSVFVHLVYFKTGSTYKVATGLDHIGVPGRRVFGASTVGYPVLCDWDGDDVTEIIMGSNIGGLFCWQPIWNAGASAFSLKPEKGWPILHRETHGSPAVGDLDGDDFMELVVSTDDGYIHVYDLPGATVAWGAAGYDLRRSGFVPPPNLLRPEQAEVSNGPAEVSIWGNPFQDEATIRFRSVAPGHAEVLIFDVAGRRVRSLLEAENLPSGVHEVKWNGRNELGDPVPSGIYFGLVRTGDFELKKRIVKAG